MPGWMNHKLESRLPGEISIASDMQMTPPLWQKVKKDKEITKHIDHENEGHTFKASGMKRFSWHITK